MINWRALYGGVGHDTQSWPEEDENAHIHGGLLHKIALMGEEDREKTARIRQHLKASDKAFRDVFRFLYGILWAIAALVAIIIVSEMAR